MRRPISRVVPLVFLGLLSLVGACGNDSAKPAARDGGTDSPAGGTGGQLAPGGSGGASLGSAGGGGGSTGSAGMGGAVSGGSLATTGGLASGGAGAGGGAGSGGTGTGPGAGNGGQSSVGTTGGASTGGNPGSGSTSTGGGTNAAGSSGTSVGGTSAAGSTGSAGTNTSVGGTSAAGSTGSGTGTGAGGTSAAGSTGSGGSQTGGSSSSSLPDAGTDLGPAADATLDLAQSDAPADLPQNPDTGGSTMTLEACFADLPAPVGFQMVATRKSSDNHVRMRIALDTLGYMGTSGTYAWRLIRLAIEVDGQVTCIKDQASLGYTLQHHNCGDTATATSGSTTYKLSGPDRSTCGLTISGSGSGDGTWDLTDSACTLANESGVIPGECRSGGPC